MIMKTHVTTQGLIYQAPSVEIYSFEAEGILCDSDFAVTGDTGASWKDETDASLPW